MSSHGGLEQGIVDVLRQYFGDTEGKVIGPVPPNGQPPPGFGQWYIGVCQATSTRGPSQSGDLRDQVYTVVIGITFKASVAPYDRLGWMAQNPNRNIKNFASIGANTEPFEQGIYAVADAVAGLIEERYEPINAANAYLDSRFDGFVEPFHNVSVGVVQEKNASWIHSDAKLRTGEIMYLQVVASGARRIRAKGAIDEQD